MATDKRNHYLLAGMVGSVLSSIAWITEQEAILRLSPLTVATGASLLAALVMAPYALRAHRIPSKPDIVKLWRPFLAVLVLRNIVGFMVFTSALALTSSAKVMFLTKIEPYVVLFLHWAFYKERVPSKDLGLLLIHVLGAVILSTGGDFRLNVEQIGDLLILLGIFANALVYRPAKLLAESWGSGFVTVLGSALSGIILLPFALYFHFDDLSFAADRGVGYAYLFLTVIIFYVISTTLWFYSLKGVEPWLSSALRCVGPIAAAPIAWFCFDKALTPPQLFGAALVILTSAGLVRNANKRSIQAERIEHPEVIAPADA